MNALFVKSALLRTPRVCVVQVDPFSMRVRCLPLRALGGARRSPDGWNFALPAAGRRQFLKLLGGSLLLPWALGDELSAEETAKSDFVSQDLEPSKLWDGDKQLVFAYKRGETLGEACQRLADAQPDLPVSLLWRLPPDWVRKFPTIHFEVSSRRWKKYDQWESAAAFSKYYDEFNPPPKSAEEPSPFKSYAASFSGDEWTYPGKIREHLLDPGQRHRFSEFELRGLTKQEMENLHSAHHEELIAPGRRPPRKRKALSPEQLSLRE